MVNWREVPFVRLLLPLLIGISIALYADTPLPFLNSIILFLFITIALVAWRPLQPPQKNFFSAAVHLCILLCAYQLTIQQNDFHHPQHFRHSLSEENTFIGQVEDVRSNGRFLNASLRITQVQQTNGQIQNTCGSILLSFDQSELDSVPNYGDRLMLSAHISPVEAPKNPEAFDYRAYLRHKGIHHQAFIKAGEWITLERKVGNPLMTLTRQWSHNLLDILAIYLPSENEYSVGAAMLLGYRDNMNDDIKNAYANTGATHVMSVSGLHIGLVFLGVGLLLRLLPWRNQFMRFFKPFVMLSAVWLFALLTGAAPSALRAAFMFSLIIISQSLNREGSIYNAMAASAFCLLCYNPYLVMDVGFQLSYLAVAGIVYFQQKIYGLWYIENKLGDYLWKLSCVGLASQVTTFPLSIFFFHQFPVYFWLSGLIVVPAASLVIGLGSLLIVCHYWLGFLSPLVGKLLLWVLYLMNGSLFLIQQLPAVLIEGIWAGGLVLVLLYLVITLVIFAIQSERARWLVYALGLFSLVMVSTAFTNIRQQQDAAFVVYHSPKHTLIDVINGQSLVSLSDESLSQKKKKQASDNYRMSKGIRDMEELLLEKNFAIEKGPFKYQKPLAQFYDYRLALVDTLSFGQPPVPIEVDYLILYGYCDYQLADLQQYFDFDTLVIGTSNRRKQTARWLSDCEAAQIPCYNITEKGAFLLHPKQKPHK
jgi:competence protein ComEC